MKMAIQVRSLNNYTDKKYIGYYLGQFFVVHYCYVKRIKDDIIIYDRAITGAVNKKIVNVRDVSSRIYTRRTNASIIAAIFMTYILNRSTVGVIEDKYISENFDYYQYNSFLELLFDYSIFLLLFIFSLWVSYTINKLRKRPTINLYLEGCNSIVIRGDYDSGRIERLLSIDDTSTKRIRSFVYQNRHKKYSYISR